MPDATNYTPNLAVLERLRQVTLVAVVGPTAVGKSTLIDEAVVRDPDIHLVLTMTSRAPRPGEREGVDYFFRSHGEMLEQMARQAFVQVAPATSGDLYATTPEAYSTKGVSTMGVWANALPVFRALPFKAVRSIFIVPPNYEIWQARIAERNFTAEQLRARMQEAKESFEFALGDGTVRYVINNEIAQATQDFVELALGEPLPPQLQADQTLARERIKTLQQRLSGL